MNGRSLRILQITDPHLHADPDARMRGVQTDATLRAVLAHALADPDRPDVIAATGDLVQDETRAGYRRFRDLTGALGVPVLCIPGNHDAPAHMAEVLEPPVFQIGGTADYGPWRLVLLSTYSPGDDAGVLAPTELERLDRALAGKPPHALIFLHHHPLPVGSRWLDGVALRNPGDFFAVVDRHPQVRAIVCGHVHQESQHDRRGVSILSTPSTCAQFLPRADDFALDVLPPAYRWLDLHDDGRIESRVVWVPARAE